ncbi:MAG: Uncharacterised protein [Prochlorococcus marinus str. MIT 9215]|nr:MAG: Uncharacterised protein [Prochlorococcus marinus str. MIT 9215]
MPFAAIDWLLELEKNTLIFIKNLLLVLSRNPAWYFRYLAFIVWA